MHKFDLGNIGVIIQQLRQEKGLSQVELAKVLKIPRPSVSQIENGHRDLSFFEFYQLLTVFNLSYDEFINYGQKEVKPTKRKKGINPKVLFNPEKFKQLFLYILERCGGKPNVGETVLYKLLYFCDFDYFELYEKPLTGMKYKKMQFGPVPDQVIFNPVIQEMRETGMIERVNRPYIGDTIQTRYINFVESDLRIFNSLEIKIIDNVIARLSDLSARQIEDHVHKDYPWIAHENNEEIEYISVFQRTGEFAQRDYDKEFLETAAQDIVSQLSPLSQEEYEYYMSLPDDTPSQ